MTRWAAQMPADTTPPEPPTEALPPFDQLYRPGAVISPRMAYWLWATAQILGDTWRSERRSGEDLTEWFPVVARPYAKGLWLDRFIVCFDALAERLARGVDEGHGLPNCTGEELALHFVFDAAVDFIEDSDSVAEDVAALRPGGDDKADFAAARHDLFADHDVVLLFDPAFDGIEDPAGFLATAVNLVNLHPDKWFVPFDSQVR